MTMQKNVIDGSNDNVDPSRQRAAAHNQSSDGNPKSNPTGNAIKDPETWTTKDEPLTGAQASYLKTLSEEAGEAFDENLTKAQASEKIDQLQKVTGRGQPQS